MITVFALIRFHRVYPKQAQWETLDSLNKTKNWTNSIQITSKLISIWRNLWSTNASKRCKRKRKDFCGYSVEGDQILKRIWWVYWQMVQNIWSRVSNSTRTIRPHFQPQSTQGMGAKSIQVPIVLENNKWILKTQWPSLLINRNIANRVMIKRLFEILSRPVQKASVLMNSRWKIWLEMKMEQRLHTTSCNYYTRNL